MFVGHYAVSLAVKSRDRTTPLWLLFLAVQFVDVLFFSLSFFGIERFNIVPNYTASTHFELVYMPYTHGLFASAIWGLATYGLFRLPALRFSKRAALGMAVAVVSHWVLDFIVHTRDLPLLGDNSMKVGLGLWENSVATFVLEAILLGLGAWFFLKNDESAQTRRRIVGFVIALVAINAVNIFGPAGDATPTALAVAALGSYFAFAAVAYWAADRKTAGT